MAVADPTLLEEGNSGAGGASYTTGTFAPAADHLLWIAIHGVGGLNDSNDWETPTDDIGDTGGGSWTRVGPTADASSNFSHLGLFYRKVGSSPSATSAITVGNVDDVSSQAAWIVYETDGHDTTTPISESDENEVASGGGTTGLSCGTLAGAAAGNLIFYAAGCRENGSWTGDTDFTTLTVEYGPSINNASVIVGYDPNDDEITATVSVDSNEGFQAAIVEIAAAGGGGGTILPMMMAHHG